MRYGPIWCAASLSLSLSLYIYIYIHTHTHTHTHIYIQGVSGEIVNVLGGGSMDYSE